MTITPSYNKPPCVLEEAMKVAANRPREGSWSSPLSKARVPDFDEDEVDDLDLDIVITGPERGIALKEAPVVVYEDLPKPLTQREREDVLRSIPPTATFEMLSKIPREVLELESEEGQELRCKLLRGSTVVFFCAGYPGKRFIYNKAAKLGVKSVIIDSHDSWARQLETNGVIAKFIGIDMDAGTDKVFKQALDAIRSLETDNKTGPADAVTTFVELAVSAVARLAEALGLPGSTPYSVDTARDKHLTRKAMDDAGLPGVKSMLITSQEQLETAAELIGFPAVLKPVAGAASLGVVRVLNKDELVSGFKRVTLEMSNLVISAGALERKVVSNNKSEITEDVGFDASKMINIAVMMEEYLDGCEVDIDIVMSEGLPRYCQVTDNGPCYEPYYAETWAALPSHLPINQIEELKQMAIDSVRCLKFTDGIFHVEGKYTSHGPRLIEVNARMGGGPIRQIHKIVFNMDMVVEGLLIACGIPSRPLTPLNPICHVGYCFVNALSSGFLPTIDWIHELEKDDPNIVWCHPLCKAQDKIVGPEEGLPSWIAEIVVKGNSVEECTSKVQDLCVRVAKLAEQRYE